MRKAPGWVRVFQCSSLRNSREADIRFAGCYSLHPLPQHSTPTGLSSKGYGVEHTLTVTEPTFHAAGVKGHSLVIVHDSDCVVGLEEPLNLERSWQRPKPNQQAKQRPRSEAQESNSRLKSGPVEEEGDGQVR